MRQRAGQADQRGLGRGVACRPPGRHQATYRGHDGDRTASGGQGGQGGKAGAGADDGGVQRDAQRPRPALVVDVAELAHAAAARAGQQPVQAAGPFGDGIQRAADIAANRSSPVTDWLRELARLAHQECGGPGVGAIGMCLTGSFVLSMAVDPVMLAPVLAQPGMPAFRPTSLDIGPADLRRVQERTQTEGLSIRGYRFQGDRISSPARFETLRTAFGPAFVGTELPDACGNPAGERAKGRPPHAVFTTDLVDAPGEPTRAAVDEIIAFFREKLAVI